MQSVSSRFWTRIAVSIPYDDNHYTTGTSCYLYNTKFIIMFVYNSKQFLWKVNFHLNESYPYFIIFVELYTIKTGIVICYLLTNSTTLKLYEQEYEYEAVQK